MSMELITLISLGLTVITLGIMLAGLILHGQRTQRADIKALREETQSEFKSVREEIGGLRERMAHVVFSVRSVVKTNWKGISLC